MSQSHFDSLRNDYKTSCLSYETVPKSNFSHTKVNIAGNSYNISNRLTLVSLNNEQQIINSETNWDPTKIPAFVDFRIPRLYNHLINQIFLNLQITTTANCKLLPFSALFDHIDITRSNSLNLQRIEWEETLLYNMLNASSALKNLDDTYHIWSYVPINTTTKSCYIKLSTIFPPGTLLDKFEGSDLKFRVYFKQASLLLTSDSTSQDSTKVGLSDCKLKFDLFEIPLSTYNTIMKEEWLDFYTVIPEVYDPYTPNLAANTNYDLQLSEFNNCAVGFLPFQKLVSNPVKNEDEVSFSSYSLMQLKHQNNQEITPQIDDAFMKIINSFKMKGNQLITSNSIGNFYFWCNDVESCINNKNLIDGYYNFGGENQKLSFTMSNATTSILILYFKIVITRISRDNILVINT